MRAAMLACACICVVWLLPVTAVAAAFSVFVDHTTIGRDHTLLLSARLAGTSDPFKLDVTSLAKEFYVTAEHETQHAGLWREKHYRLGAKRTGAMVVPALSVVFHGKQLSSQPFPVKVLDTDGDVNDVRLWVENGVSRKRAWVHQQLLWHASILSTYPFSGTPHMQIPEFDGFDVQPMDADIPGERVRHGRRLFVRTWHVLLFPRRAGDLHIAPPLASARILQMLRTQRIVAGGPDFDAGEKRMHARKAAGSKQHIRVRALPAAAAHLPVGQLELAADIPDTHAYVAEPLTWSIHLTAKGMRQSDMPGLNIPLLARSSFAVMREKPLISVHRESGRVNVDALYRVLLTPSRAGAVHIPGIEIAFFNPGHGRIEHASLVSRPLQVMPQRKASQHEGFDIAASGSSRHVYEEKNDASSRWKTVAIGLLMLWLATIVLWVISSRVSWSPWSLFPRRRRPRTPSLRRVLAARDATAQFTALKQALALPGRMTPLELLVSVQGLRDSEMRVWLEAIERCRWQGGILPLPLDSKHVHDMVRIIQENMQQDGNITLGTFNPADFGRIGV